MGIWYELIPFFALLASNLLISKSISKYSDKEKIPLLSSFICFLAPVIYGVFFVIARRVNMDMRIGGYTVFFLNNLWLLIQFRSSIIAYNKDITLSKYFIFSMIVFISPVTLLITLFKFADFSALVFSISYILGLFPIVILTSLIIGISVKSRFWGIILSCFLFTIDLLIRTGVLNIIPEDLRIPVSETFRTLSVLLIFFIIKFGTTLPRKESKEIFEGTSKLNNVFFCLLAVFPIMLFFTTFWQVNISYKEQQENECAIAKEVFSLSLNILENDSDKLLSQIEEIVKSSSLSMAQWKLKSLQQLNDKVQNVQIISSDEIYPEGITVSFSNGRVEIIGVGTKSWIIKVDIDLKKMYYTLPVDNNKELYIFNGDDTILSPPNSENGGALKRSSKYKNFLEKQSTDFAYKGKVKFFGNEFSTYLVFETSVPEINLFTLIMILLCIFLLVLVWSFHSYYIDRWESNGKKYLESFSESKNDFGNTIEKLESNLTVLSKDMKESESKIEVFSKNMVDTMNVFSKFDFIKGAEIELIEVYKKIRRDYTWIKGIMLFKKGAKGWQRECNLYLNDDMPVIPLMLSQDSQFVKTEMKEDKKVKVLLTTKKEYLISWVLDSKKIALNNHEKNMFNYIMDISVTYEELYGNFSKQDQVSEKYRIISSMLLKTDEAKKEGKLLEIILKYIQKLFPNAIVCGSVELKNSIPVFYWYKGKGHKKTVESVSLNPDQYETLIAEINSGIPIFSLNSSERKTFSENSRSGILLPVHVDSNEKFAVILEFSDYKLFSNFEKEFVFFLGKVLSDVFKDKK